jgi:hypothetical protein
MKMKQKVLLSLAICTAIAFYSCKSNNESVALVEFKHQAHLDSLIAGQIDYGSSEVNESFINMLNFQKKHNCGEANGTVIPKSQLAQALNGFTESGINLPLDSSNYVKWDFLVVYPGISINAQGEESPKPAVFYYKGTIGPNGDLIPSGKPILDIKFIGGGGGPGDGAKATPPPTTTPTP